MADRLERYREMRDFGVTPEPRGKRVSSREKALHYYIQRHDATRLHYDFRLELDGALKSWAVPKGPSLDPKDRRLAVEVEDHPLDYGEFEGTIPEKQYGAGDVLLWDRGLWTSEDADPGAALKKGTLHFRLDGEKLQGRWVLTRTRRDEKKPQWLLIKRNDEHASAEVDIIEARPESVKRAPRKARRAKKAKLPAFVTPQLATLVTAPPKSGNWVYEVKYDGYRMLARIAGGEVALFTRAGNDWTGKLPHLAQALGKLGVEDAWLDGEIVVPGADGRASFQALQNAFDAGADSKIVYYVFDAPYLDGKDLRQLPLKARKQKLKAKFARPVTGVRFSDDLTGSAQKVLEHACKLRLEGLIAKQADAVYQAGRTRTWLKLKCRLRQDFVIAGYTAPKGSRSGFGALVVGVYEKPRKLVYAGKVGTGFDEERLSTLLHKFSSLKTSESPLENPPREKGITWLRPKLVAEVEFAERTNEGIIRQGSFMGLRQDMPAKAVGVEKAQTPPEVETQIRITHPDRLIYPSLKFSKGDLARYYAEVADWMLPHVANRPLTLVRCPDGAEAKCFYQRHLGMGASPGDLKTFARLGSSKGKYLYLESKRGILSAVQNGAVEFHTWGASVPDAKHPDRITMDLDPGPGVTWGNLVKATKLTRTLLEKLGLKCFLKTTGGKGLHVVAPLEPKLEWDEVKEFTRLVAEFLVKAEPGLFVAQMSKAKRKGRVFVDYLRNAETASAVSAYSARARKEAGVSTPLEWDELGRADVRARFTVKSVPKRLAKLTLDPWAEYSSTRQSITPTMLRSLQT
jgi:bifunctional non-homologous end joining protein LigD